MTQLLPPKKEVALALLERSNVDIYLDPRADGVVVPPQFRKDPRLILKIGLNMPVPIPDLRLDDESMSCTLSFNRAKFFCVVPWSSVFAMVGDDGRGMVWPDDVPQELAVKVDRAPGDLGVPPSSSGGRAKEGLKEVPAGAAAAADGEPSERGAKKRSKKKKDEAAPRPMLVAVPSPAPSQPRLEKVEKLREEKREDNREEKPAAAPAAAPRPAASGRPKRELPPYLRVVK